MKKITLVSLFLVWIMSGCNGTISPKSPEINSPVESVETLVTTSPQSAINTQCINVSRNQLLASETSGKLVLASPVLTGNYFLEMTTGKTYLLTEDEGDLASNFSISPNGEWLAYIGRNQFETVDSLVVQSSNGQKTFNFPIDYNEWQSVAYWLNNTTLVLWNHASPLDNIISYDPFTESKQIMRNEYPNILPNDSGWDQFWPSISIYSPSLKQVVYLATSSTGYETGNSKLVLWDFTKNQPIAQIDDFGYTSVYPIWKLNGDGVVLVKALTGFDPPARQDELFFLASNGEAKQLTKLGDIYKSPSIYSMSLSPDERFLAFELVTNFSRKVGESIDRRLLILNIATLEIMDYCLSPEQFAHLTWSPNSQHLAFSKLLPDGDVQTVVLDVLNGNAFVVADHLRPAGWLNQ